MIISSKPKCPPLDANWKIHIDGATFGSNPSAIGSAGLTVWVNNTLYHAETFQQIGSTNNRAEFFALMKSLFWARNRGLHNIDIYSDSDIVVKWANGHAQLKDEHLLRLAAACDHTRFQINFNVYWVSRDDEHQAFTDYVAKLGLANEVEFKTAKQHKLLIGAYYECLQSSQLKLSL